MAGNTFGTLFTMTTFGETHGESIGCIVDGCPAGMKLDAKDIQPFLDKRKPGQSKNTSQRREPDCVQILSGVFEGKTTGSPIALSIANIDSRSRDYESIKHLFRPGHADFTYHHKYGHRDYRGGGRSSARETANWVAAGAIACLYLQRNFNITIVGYLRQVGTLVLDDAENAQKNANSPCFSADPPQLSDLSDYIDKIRRQGDSVGARVDVIAYGVPIGLGEPVFRKLDAAIAHAMMTIPAVKGVEIGDGFEVVNQLGSQHRDEMSAEGFLSNHSGGVLGGISTGQPLRVSLALKPTSSITTPGRTQNINGDEVEIITKGRHDPCVGIRAVPVAEAMMALVLMDYILQWQAYN